MHIIIYLLLSNRIQRYGFFYFSFIFFLFFQPLLFEHSFHTTFWLFINIWRACRCFQTCVQIDEKKKPAPDRENKIYFVDLRAHSLLFELDTPVQWDRFFLYSSSKYFVLETTLATENSSLKLNACARLMHVTHVNLPFCDIVDFSTLASPGHQFYCTAVAAVATATATAEWNTTK